MLQFTKPAYLILLIPLIYFMYRMTKHSLADMSAFRAKASLVLRSVILLMLVLALADVRMVRDVSQQCVVFALDMSDSIPKSKRDSAVEYINRALKNLTSNQKAAVVVFGENASVELSPGSYRKIGQIHSTPATTNTDISQSIGLAMAVFPEHSSKKIILLSDGNETRGKALEQALLASSNNVSVDTVPLTTDLPNDIYLDKMVSPATAKIGEPFDLRIIASAKEPSKANIRLFRNGTPFGVKYIELAKGKNILSFQQSIDKPGSYEYRAIMDNASDTRPENNIAMSYTIVKGKPKVLYVEGIPGQSRYLTGAISNNSIQVDVRDKSGIPRSMTDMQEYDMIILSDVPAWNMIPEQMLMVKSAVKDLGIGFTMIGGENSFGAGGYFDTPIEETLPLDMSLKKTKVLPSLSIIIVMDKSGSMSMIQDGREKIQLANDAAASVVKLLQPIDKVGIIVCHSSPSAPVPLRQADNKDPIYSEISTIRAEGGGIAVFPSLDMAYNMIKGSGTRQKHIILLADGDDCDDQEGVLPLTKKMAAERITLTTVAIGSGKDVPFLKNTAFTGRGSFYLTTQARDLKAIFTKDVLSVSKALIIEEPFIPVMDYSSQELSGITPGTVPPLLGYVATSAKPAATILAKSNKKDPILAVWQYGLGKSAAFTSDCKARWGARWVSWPEYGRFWSQILRSTMRRGTTDNFQTVVDIDGGTGHVTVDAVDANGVFLNMLNLKGSVVTPDMRGHPLHVEQTGPGRYEADFDARDTGTYLVSVGKAGKTGTSSNVSAVSIPYPQEYRNSDPNINLLKRIAAETSGSYNPSPSEALTRNFKKSRAYTELWRLLLILSALILPFDIAVRRIALEPRQLAELLNAIMSRIAAYRSKSKDKVVETDSAVTESLLKVKNRIPKADSNPGLVEKLRKPDDAVPSGSTVDAVKEAPSNESAAPDTNEQHMSKLLDAKRRRRGG
ncbi:MAG: VWA domain-containing protein [Armatimonadota bacterium]